MPKRISVRSLALADEKFTLERLSLAGFLETRFHWFVLGFLGLTRFIRSLRQPNEKTEHWVLESLKGGGGRLSANLFN